MVKKSQAGGGVAVKIEHAVYQSAKMFGRHFDDKDDILSHITRQSIDVLKVGKIVLYWLDESWLSILCNNRTTSGKMSLMKIGCSFELSNRYACMD